MILRNILRKVIILVLYLIYAMHRLTLTLTLTLTVFNYLFFVKINFVQEIKINSYF